MKDLMCFWGGAALGVILAGFISYDVHNELKRVARSEIIERNDAIYILNARTGKVEFALVEKPSNETLKTLTRFVK